MGKYDIQTHTENCTGCLRCQLACSDFYSKAFNPAVSRIQVFVSNSGECTIDFTKECIACGICVDHCFYDAVQKTKKEGDQ